MIVSQHDGACAKPKRARKYRSNRELHLTGSAFAFESDPDQLLVLAKMEHGQLLALSGSEDWREKRRRLGRSADDHGAICHFEGADGWGDSSDPESDSSEME